MSWYFVLQLFMIRWYLYQSRLFSSASIVNIFLFFIVGQSGSKLPSSYSADDSDENITSQARTRIKKGKTIYLSNHFISYHIKSHHFTSHEIKSLHIRSDHFIYHDIASRHIISYHITSHHITSHHIRYYNIIFYQIRSHHITSHHITSHHITSHHITSHHLKYDKKGIEWSDYTGTGITEKIEDCWNYLDLHRDN